MKTAAPFFSVPTMIIGSDVSHPTPGSPQASMAALTMSMDQEAVRYAAAVQTNGIRVEMITRANIISMMMPLFHEWIKKVGGGRGPSHIYYFRDGVSEGQYMHVLDEEVKDMKSAIREKYGPVNVSSIIYLKFYPTKHLSDKIYSHRLFKAPSYSFPSQGQ
jgi:eukaryotic translation initiation factor 2C